MMHRRTNCSFASMALPLICSVALTLPKVFVSAAPDYSTELYGSLSEGSTCTMEDGSDGKCVELPRCPMRIREVIAGKRFSTSTGRCSFKDFVEIVCCPKDDIRETTDEKDKCKNDNNTTNCNNGKGKENEDNRDESGGTISNKLGLRPADAACHEYENEIIGQDGEIVNPNIFNGERAAVGEFPYMVALGYRTDKANPSIIRYNCGGTLVSTRYVLTAAHCVNNINNYVPVEVRLGSVDLTDDSKYVQRIPVAETISHPQYKRSLNYYDIAVLKLRRQVNVSQNVMPICLQTKPIPHLQQLVNMSLVVTGWGATSFEDEASASLQKTPTLSIVDQEECNRSYKGFSKLSRGVDETMICILDKNVTRRADACQGDSGGPLLLLSKVSSTIIGITSFGQSCGSSIPAIYSSVLAHLDWIEQVVWPDKKRSF